eukprot:Skav226977  [mRNA]  locus=scaffold927:51713:52313:- [translate_table: standard]
MGCHQVLLAFAVYVVQDALRLDGDDNCASLAQLRVKAQAAQERRSSGAGLSKELEMGNLKQILKDRNLGHFGHSFHFSRLPMGLELEDSLKNPGLRKKEVHKFTMRIYEL